MSVIGLYYLKIQFLIFEMISLSNSLAILPIAISDSDNLFNLIQNQNQKAIDGVDLRNSLDSQNLYNAYDKRGNDYFDPFILELRRRHELFGKRFDHELLNEIWEKAKLGRAKLHFHTLNKFLLNSGATPTIDDEKQTLLSTDLDSTRKSKRRSRELFGKRSGNSELENLGEIVNLNELRALLTMLQNTSDENLPNQSRQRRARGGELFG